MDRPTVVGLYIKTHMAPHLNIILDLENSVGLSDGLWAGRRGSIQGSGKKFFFSPKDPAWL
jgi:hypothetical protein